MKESEFECPITEKIYQIKVGETAQDNWDIIDAADSTDIWFHVKKFPSCHVILETDSHLSKIHKSVLYYCAGLCKEGSKHKNARRVTIIYTEVKNVTKYKKGGPGSVFAKKNE